MGSINDPKVGFGEVGGDRDAGSSPDKSQYERTPLDPKQAHNQSAEAQFAPIEFEA